MQIISYVVDVYKNKITNKPDLIKFVTYISMFPQLIAGPIIRYNDIEYELLNKNINKNNIVDGIKIFVFGLTSKVVLANFLSYVDLDVQQNILYLSGMTAWLYAICKMLQLYFDFYGYSLMSKGLCKIIGINIIDNFNNPLLSNSISTFWRRWHISLSEFFRDYIYIPLGGNKKGIIRTCINLLIVFIISGIWHGANYNFLIFGSLFGIFVIFEKLFLSNFLKKVGYFSNIYTFLLVIIIFVFFFVENIDESILCIRYMFFIGGDVFNKQFIYIFVGNLKAIILAIICIFELPQKVYKKLLINRNIQLLVVLILFIIDIVIIYIGYNDPFMYFRF